MLKTFGIAIIGSRNSTRYGEKMSFIFANDLCDYGITIVSGMAVGIDSFAHKGALSAKGSTIAVLPSGFKYIYPEKNIKLYNDILNSNGLVITEYQEEEKACSQKFRDRNRIVAGISMGTLVVEGACNSGTNITVKFTKEQEKNIFCIPSNLDSLKSYVPNKLIKEGAFLVTDAQDIIDKYSEFKLKRVLNKINDDVFFKDNIFYDKSKNVKNSNSVYNKCNRSNKKTVCKKESGNNEKKEYIKIYNENENSKYGKNVNLNIYQKSCILDDFEKIKIYQNKNVGNKNDKSKENNNINISEKYQDIYNLIRKDGLANINNLARNLNIDIQSLNVKLISMELENLIVSLPGGNYKINNF